MTEKRHPFAGLSLASLLLASACGEQASTDYQGEAILQFEGRVELLAGGEERDLVPALAFQGKHGYWPVLDVEVEGEFPAGFRLTVLDPPPDEARAELSKIWPGSPDAAFATITAATADHPSGFQRADAVIVSDGCAGVAGDCTLVKRQLCRTGEGGQTWRDSEGNELPYADCYEELRDCGDASWWETEDLDLDACTVVESSGNPELGKTADAEFAGFSQEHSVAFLYDDAPGGSLVARLLGAPEGLGAGYHLLASRVRSAEEIAQVERCSDEAQSLALERLTAEHPETTCENFGTADGGVGIGCDGEDPTAILFGQYIEDASAELECPFIGDSEFHPVDPREGRITIEIGEDLGGFPGDISASL